MMRFQQTDTPATYTGPSGTPLVANGATCDRLCGGTPGTTLTLITMDALARNKYAVSFDIAVPPYTLWGAGTWTVPLNVAWPNQCVGLSSIYIMRLSGSGAFQQLLGFRQFLNLPFVGPGILTVNVSCEGAPTRAYYDRVLVVCGFTNDGTLPPYNLQVNTAAQTFGITPSELIWSPFDG